MTIQKISAESSVKPGDLLLHAHKPEYFLSVVVVSVKKHTFICLLHRSSGELLLREVDPNFFVLCGFSEN